MMASAAGCIFPHCNNQVLDTQPRTDSAESHTDPNDSGKSNVSFI